MTVPATVRVLPPSRPEPLTRLVAPAPRQEASPAEVGVRAGRPRPGRVVRVGRAWGAGAPEELPDATRWSGWLALALSEAVLGRRPATQLAGWVAADVLAGLHRRQRLRLAEEATARTVLLSGRVQHPGPRSAEASAVVRSGHRLVVLAFRLEGRDSQWLCTALEAGVTSGPRQRPSPGVSSAATAAG